MKEFIDQAAHYTVAMLVVGLPQLAGPTEISVVGGAFIGFMLGLVREVTEEDEVSLAALGEAIQSKRDLLWWTLGGLVGGLW